MTDPDDDETKTLCINCACPRMTERIYKNRGKYICQNCGKSLSRENKFVYCPYCGTKVFIKKTKIEKNKNKL